MQASLATGAKLLCGLGFRLLRLGEIQRPFLLQSHVNPERPRLPPDSQATNPTGWGPLVISRVIRALNWVIRTLS